LWFFSAARALFQPGLNAVLLSGSSSLSRGDIQNVILSLVDQVPKYLLDGQSVELGELGTLRIGFSSEGVQQKDEFSTSQIDDVKIIFSPSRKLKQMLATARYEVED
jgi:predicted histone-like DNA-binding protein